MKYADQLREWAEAERAKGLVDIDFFPGKGTNSSIEDAAKSVLDALNSKDLVDVTDDPI